MSEAEFDAVLPATIVSHSSVLPPGSLVSPPYPPLSVPALSAIVALTTVNVPAFSIPPV